MHCFRTRHTFYSHSFSIIWLASRNDWISKNNMTSWRIHCFITREIFYSHIFEHHLTSYFSPSSIFISCQCLMEIPMIFCGSELCWQLAGWGQGPRRACFQPDILWQYGEPTTLQPGESHQGAHILREPLGREVFAHRGTRKRGFRSQRKYMPHMLHRRNWYEIRPALDCMSGCRNIQRIHLSIYHMHAYCNQAET